MTDLFDFKKRFGKTINVEEVKKNFVNKFTHLLIEPLERKVGMYYGDSGTSIFDFVALAFNEIPSEIISIHNQRRFGNEEYRPPFSYFTRNDFERTLLFIEVIYNYFRATREYDREQWLTDIDKAVAISLDQPISLGVSWREGKFYPEGAEEMDHKLILDVLKWLEKYPKSQALFNNALDHYSQSLADPIKRKDVISNSFQSLEKLTKDFLQTTKDSFDNNFGELVTRLNLDKKWVTIINSYKELSKEFGRHAGRDDFIPEKEDTEAFLYLSGLIMRLILQKK